LGHRDPFTWHRLVERGGQDDALAVLLHGRHEHIDRARKEAMKRRQHRREIQAGTDLAGQMEHRIRLDGRKDVASHGEIGHVGLTPART
jgi:hypothetical protein